MEHQLRQVGWEADFLPAIRPAETAGFPSIGARGCFLSHLEVLKRGILTNNHILIMEDDLDFTTGFSRLWQQAIETLQNTEWSIFYPAHLLQTQLSGLHMIEPSQGMLCTHFMMVNRNAASTVIDALESILARPAGHPMGGPMHVDGAYSTIRQQNPLLNTYVFCPTLGYQRASRSDIADLRFFDRVPLLRSVVAQWRTFRRN
jgi:glycosyl transferase, family 25